MNLSDIELSVRPAKILAVSKLQPLSKIQDLYSQGQKRFGENYVQEALEKIDALQNLSEIEWHLIGHLQKNKVKFVVGKFHLIHSVDSWSLLEYLDKKCAEKNIRQNILLQVNIAEEDSKGGFSEPELLAQWPQISSLKNVSILGLMTMPPLTESAEQVRPYFRRLRELRDSLQNKNLSLLHPLSELSMGTSGDYRVAVEEGATIIRLGTILFGERPRKG